MTLSFGVHAIAPVLPLVQTQFDLTEFEVGLVTVAYVLPGVLFAMPLGMLADIVGRRWMFGASAVVFGIAGALQGLSGSFEWLLFWRLVQGLAFASLMPLTLTIIGDVYSGLAQIRAQSARHISMAGADLVVPLIGAQLALVAWFLPFTAQAVTVLPGLAALWVLRTAPGEKRTTQPMRGYVGRAVRSVGEAGFPSVLMLAFLRFFGRFALLTYLPLQLTRELGASLSEVGVVMSVVGGLGFVSATLAGRVSAHVRPSVIVLVSLLSVAGAMFGFASLPSMTFALAVAVVYALGDGFIGVMQSSFAARGAPANVRAGLVAVNGTARNAGKLVSPLLIGTVAAVSTVGVGLAITAAVMLAGIAVVPGLRRLDHALRQDDSDRSGDVGDPVERASQ